ncbi:MAG: altronate dehydratase [Lentisphaeria bacterium]|nr:altronate dehydratase [Lentisphaeria bacterium]
MENNMLQISPADNVAVALSGEMTGHKFALVDIAKGEKVIKYGMPIGYATEDIAKGAHVHTHNVKTLLNEHAEYEYNKESETVLKTDRHDSFLGYRRCDGTAGIRNDLWIIPTVGCVNSLAENLAKAFNASAAPDMKAIPFVHPYGCSQLGDDHERTADLLAAFCKHPNAGGVLVVALGCENNTLESFKERLGDISGRNIAFLRAQDAGDEFSAGMDLLEELKEKAAVCQRETIPVSELKIGLKCGGSDGFSGITANPLVGRISDLLIAQGGTSVLTEVPEMFGAETLLMNRCVTREVFEKCVDMINGIKDYFVSHGQVVYENPSPGNKAGGITTLEDKSLGCTQKGGLSPVVDVLAYGDQLKKPGLNLLSGPGNDMVASTVLAAAGCQIVLFTTGRGTPFGTVVPTLKIATNSALAENKKNWIDFNAGQLLEGKSMEALADEFFDHILAVANGTVKAKNEVAGFQEITIFKDGVTL